MQRFPKSPRIPFAYLAFGELFFRESADDPSKSSLAKQSYLEVLKFPAAQNPAWGLASLRVAALELGRPTPGSSPFVGAADPPDPARALAAATRAVEALAGDAPCSVTLADEARRTAVDAYAIGGRPDLAHTFFKRFEDPRRPESALDGLLVRLLGIYGQAHDDASVVALVSDVAARGPSPVFCDAARAALDGAAGAAGAPTAAAKLRLSCDRGR